MDSAPENVVDRAVALKKALTKCLKIAVIDLDEGQKPHVIFETLNARSEPLKQSDLIKNTVMYEANVMMMTSENDNFGACLMTHMATGNQEGRLTRIHLDRFLNYWMVCGG